MKKKIVIEFYENDTIKKITCKNCVQSNAILAGNKLISKAKELPEKRKKSIFKRFVSAVKYACEKTDIDRCEKTDIDRRQCKYQEQMKTYEKLKRSIL